MTVATVGRAAAGARPAVRSGAVTQAERDTLARKLAAAQGKDSPPAPPSSPAPRARRRTPPPPPKADPTPAPEPAAAPDSEPRPRPAETPPAGRAPRRVWGTETAGQSAAGLILGLLFWGWIILPMVRGGPDEVRDVLRAKFLNKDAEGRWLP